MVQHADIDHTGLTGVGGGGDLYFSRRVLSTIDNANVTWNVNNGTGAHVAFGVTQFYHDWDIFPATHFLITSFGQSSEAAQTITMQLTPAASPTNPVSASGDDHVIANSTAARSSGWIAVSDAMSGLTLMTLAAKGSNSSVDFQGRWIDIAFKIDV